MNTKTNEQKLRNLILNIPIAQKIGGRNIHEVMTTQEISEILEISTLKTYQFLTSLSSEIICKYGYRVNGGWEDFGQINNPKSNSVGWQLNS